MTKRTRTRPWVWRWPDRTEQGVMVSRGGRELFIPQRDLYRVADLLVDHAERIDTEQENTP